MATVATSGFFVFDGIFPCLTKRSRQARLSRGKSVVEASSLLADPSTTLVIVRIDLSTSLSDGRYTLRLRANYCGRAQPCIQHVPSQNPTPSRCPRSRGYRTFNHTHDENHSRRKLTEFGVVAHILADERSVVKHADPEGAGSISEVKQVSAKPAF